MERLNLADNKGGDEGCRSLAHLLTVNSHLKALNLFGNRITTEGAISLADALRCNTTLEHLNLAGNTSIQNAGYYALESMIQENYSIQHLWLPTPFLQVGLSIPSFIRLNKLNRRRLIAEMDNAQLWLNAIQACADDAICVYYLLRMNPAVISWLP